MMKKLRLFRTLSIRQICVICLLSSDFIAHFVPSFTKGNFVILIYGRKLPNIHCNFITAHRDNFFIHDKWSHSEFNSLGNDSKLSNFSDFIHYHPRMWVGNVFGHVCLSVCLCVCVSVCSGYNF